jgi:hypothetical protein
MTKNNTVIMKIHAGGLYKGSVVFTAINPHNLNDQKDAYSIKELFSFCENRGLQRNEDFENLVKKHLVFQKNGFAVSEFDVDDNRVISSVQDFLFKNFLDFLN